MSTTLRSLGRKPVAAIGATVLVVGAAGLATATGGDPQAPPTRGATPSSVEVVKCDGGAQKRVYNRIVSSPFTFGEGAAVAVPGAGVAVPGPARGTDTLTITFSGEANITGYTDTDERWNWLGLEVLVDGVPIQPYTAVGDVMAFHGPGGYDMNSATFCTKIRKGPHSVRVRTNLYDGGTDDALNGWLDDYTLSVEQSE